MNSAKKFFDDNISRTSAQADPLGWNLNLGLAALAEQMDAIQRSQAVLEQRLQRIEHWLQSRLR